MVHVKLSVLSKILTAVTLCFMNLQNSKAFSPSSHIQQKSHSSWKHLRNPSFISTSTSSIYKLDDVDQSSKSSLTERKALLDPYVMTSTLSSATTLSESITSNGLFTVENIKVAFSLATFLPQPVWIFLIVFPNAKITKQIMGTYGIPVITFFALIHFFIVFASIMQPNGTAPLAEFNDVFDPSGDPQGAMLGMMKYPNFVSEEWSHVLTWDLFVGRWIWMDGLKKGVFTNISCLFCNLIGPPGFLIHLITCLVSGKGLPGDYEEFDLEE